MATSKRDVDKQLLREALAAVRNARAMLERHLERIEGKQVEEDRPALRLVLEDDDQ